MVAEDLGAMWPMIVAILAAVILNAVIFTIWKGYKARKEQNEQKKWWKENVIYHIYPRSFQDSSGDGNGDLRGIMKRLDYFEYMGIKILYLSPIFKSPMVDNGYDISDFTDIDPLFGDLNDFDELLKAMHVRDMKLVLDFVPNHTSDEHPWYLESRASRQSPKRDWYVWNDPSPGGGVPNNWVSVFGGSAWSYDTRTGQYYLHQFCPEQPDLNLRNAEVRQALKEVLMFWLDKGVDGFRVDAVPHLVEDSKFLDEPTKPEYDPLCPNYDHLEHIYTKNLWDNHKIVQEWRTLLNQYKAPYRILIGEIMADLPDVMKYYGGRYSEFDFPFNFGFLGLSKSTTAQDLYKVISDYLTALPRGKWPNWLLGNHDVSRIGTKVGHEYSRALNVLLLTLPGTAVTYYGEEIGMTDAEVPLKTSKDFRDPQRSPMQWCSKQNAGFTHGMKPWLPVAKNFKIVNVEDQMADPTSVLQLYRELLRIRSSSRCLKELCFKVVHVDSLILAYTRSAKHCKFLIIVNFGQESWTGSLDSISGSGVVEVDSEMKMRGAKILFDNIKLSKAQALVVKIP